MKKRETRRQGVVGARERCLQLLAYRYYMKNPRRSAENNWKLAERFLKRVEKRYNISNETL